jgi:hypothetical protein
MAKSPSASVDTLLIAAGSSWSIAGLCEERQDASNSVATAPIATGEVDLSDDEQV